MEYKEPIFELIYFGTDDVIRTSGETDNKTVRTMDGGGDAFSS